MKEIPTSSELGAASFYGTEETLEKVLKRYEIHPAFSDFYLKTRAEFLRQVELRMKNEDVVLDLGCSFGPVSCQIVQKYQAKDLEVKVIGIDIDERQIRNANLYAKRLRLEKYLNFYVYDARNIDELADGHLKGITKIVSLYAFHHIPDSSDEQHKNKIEVLREIHRHSTNKAVLIIGDILVPYSADNQNYQEGIRLWGLPRLKTAKRTNQEALKMEKNAQQGIIERTNEYPITERELKKMLAKTDWHLVFEKYVEPYHDVVAVAEKN